MYVSNENWRVQIYREGEVSPLSGTYAYHIFICGVKTKLAMQPSILPSSCAGKDCEPVSDLGFCWGLLFVFFTANNSLMQSKKRNVQYRCRRTHSPDVMCTTAGPGLRTHAAGPGLPRLRCRHGARRNPSSAVHLLA